MLKAKSRRCKDILDWDQTFILKHSEKRTHFFLKKSSIPLGWMLDWISVPRVVSKPRHGCAFCAMFATCCRGAAIRRANPSTAISDVFGEGAHRCVGGAHTDRFCGINLANHGSGWCRNPARNGDFNYQPRLVNAGFLTINSSATWWCRDDGGHWNDGVCFFFRVS